MSDTLADLASWLPSDFLSDNIDNNTPLVPNNNNPLFYPYDQFGSSSSTESESDDDDVTELTRGFTRSLSLQERLQMTHLSHGFSGPTLARSSPTTPFGGHTDEDSWDRLYTAAGQIARMKMMKMNTVNPDALFGPPRPVAVGPTIHNPNCGVRMREKEEFLRHQYLRRTVSGAGNYGGGGRCGVNRPLGFRHSAWPPLSVENKRLQVTANGFVVIGSGCGRGPPVVKRECAGTGVFLPRSYCPEPPEFKKPQACSPSLLPARVIRQSYNQRVDPTIIPQHQQQPNIHAVFGPQQLNINARSAKLLMARRNNALMLVQQQQLRNTGYMGVSDDVVLPQEWTY